MAKKFKIAPNPTFNQDVKIPRVGGDPMVVGFTFKYYKRTEMLDIFDKWQERAKEFEKIGEDASLREVATAEIDYQVSQVKDIVVGWDFEDEFGDDAIRELVETSPHAATSIIEVYQNAYYEARLGN